MMSAPVPTGPRVEMLESLGAWACASAAQTTKSSEEAARLGRIPVP